MYPKMNFLSELKLNIVLAPGRLVGGRTSEKHASRGVPMSLTYLVVVRPSTEPLVDTDMRSTSGLAYTYLGQKRSCRPLNPSFAQVHLALVHTFQEPAHGYRFAYTWRFCPDAAVDTNCDFERDDRGECGEKNVVLVHQSILSSARRLAHHSRC